MLDGTSREPRPAAPARSVPPPPTTTTTLPPLTPALARPPAPKPENTPTAEAVVGTLEQRFPEARLGFDHFAFRTFGVGCWARDGLWNGGLVRPPK